MFFCFYLHLFAWCPWSPLDSQNVKHVFSSASVLSLSASRFPPPFSLQVIRCPTLQALSHLPFACPRLAFFAELSFLRSSLPTETLHLHLGIVGIAQECSSFEKMKVDLGHRSFNQTCSSCCLGVELTDNPPTPSPWNVQLSAEWYPGGGVGELQRKQRNLNGADRPVLGTLTTYNDDSLVGTWKSWGVGEGRVAQGWK